MKDIKFIITKDYKHFKSDIDDHYYIAKRNGYDVKDLLETGLIIEGRFLVLECYHKEHTNRFVLNDVNKCLEDLTNYRIKKIREVVSLYSYGYIKEGD